MVVLAILAFFDIKFSQNLLYFKATIVPNFVWIWPVVGLEISKTDEKRIFLFLGSK